MKKILLLLTFVAAIAACGKSETENPTVKLSIDNLTLPAALNETSTFTFTSSSDWQLVVTDTRAIPSWFDVTPKSGMAGKITVTITVTEENATDEERIGYIKIMAGGTPKTVEIKQSKLNFSGCIYTVQPAGSLRDMLNVMKLDTITMMKLLGTIDYRDFKTMNELMPNLAYLDMSEVQLVGDSIPFLAFSVKPPSYDYGLGKLSLKSVILPKSTKTIGHDAFNGCKNLTGSLIIPDGVISIGNDAFAWDDALTGSLNSIISIGNYAFLLCTGFTGTLTIGNSVTSIGSMAFYECNFTGSLTIPDKVTTIGGFAFGDCKGFSGSLTIPSSVTSIGIAAFNGCTNLTEAKLCWTTLESIPTYPYDYFELFPKSSFPLKVPIGTKNIYQNLEGWKNYPISEY